MALTNHNHRLKKPGYHLSEDLNLRMFRWRHAPDPHVLYILEPPRLIDKQCPSTIFMIESRHI